LEVIEGEDASFPLLSLDLDGVERKSIAKSSSSRTDFFGSGEPEVALLDDEEGFCFVDDTGKSLSSRSVKSGWVVDGFE